MLAEMNSPSIVFENEKFLALNKPSGILVEQVRAVGVLVPKNPEETVQGWLNTRRSGAMLVHRLDKDTSGLLLAAKTPEYFKYLKSLFHERTIKKTYHALVYGHPQKNKGVIHASIGIKSGMTRHTIHKDARSPRASITEYHVIERYTYGDEPVSLLEVFPKTGRTHQIRVHLNSIHHPILGDALYGGNKLSNIAPRQMLHAYAIEFSMQEGGRIRLEAPPPEDFKEARNRLSSII